MVFVYFSQRGSGQGGSKEVVKDRRQKMHLYQNRSLIEEEAT